MTQIFCYVLGFVETQSILLIYTEIVVCNEGIQSSFSLQSPSRLSSSCILQYKSKTVVKKDFVSKKKHLLSKELGTSMISDTIFNFVICKNMKICDLAVLTNWLLR